ncbi:hypothetical protein DSO57_1027954 [Entomophthora muscae]|uniref:Uncharacterized protein n=1 Tax=Entomophthora muscae TaxID=34485 RepID=A0ACC2SQP6_9FUNG|nr:hypothetical protein DSO57_1027954 [Entomophthora muscae]
METRISSCDQCHLRQNKCDKILPRCSSCSSSKLACTWNRKFKNNPLPKYQNIDTFSFKAPPSSEQKKKERPVFLNYNPTPIKLCEYGTVKFTRHTLIGREIPKENYKPCERNHQDWNPTFKSWTSMATNRYIFNLLVVSLGYSHVPMNGRDRAYTTRILCITTPFRGLGWMEIFYNHTAEAWKKKIQLVYLKYMCHINPFYPLFYQHMAPHSHSELLKASIFLCGNSLLPATLIQRSLSNQLIKIITHSLAPSNLPINFNSLTSLLVLIVGLPKKLSFLVQMIF